MLFFKAATSGDDEKCSDFWTRWFRSNNAGLYKLLSVHIPKRVAEIKSKFGALRSLIY